MQAGMPYLRTRYDDKGPAQAPERRHQLAGHLGETYDEQYSAKLVMTQGALPAQIHAHPSGS